MASEEYILKIRNAIAKDEFPEAFNLLRALFEHSTQLNDVLLLSARLSDISRQIHRGIVDNEVANLTKNKIRAGVLELLEEVDNQRLASPKVQSEMEQFATYYISEKNIVKGGIEAAENISIGDTKINIQQTSSGSGDNVKGDKIKKQINMHKNSVYIEKFIINKKGGFLIFLLGIVSICIWQISPIKSFFGFDKLFQKSDEKFNILILPFKQICIQGGKNYDAGFVLSERLRELSLNDSININIKYWGDYNFADFDYQKASEFQQYHHADMVIYGAVQTSDCSAEGDQVCLNYVTDEKWGLGTLGNEIENKYRKGGLDEMRGGRIQERIENIAIFISTISQIKNIDQKRYLSRLQGILNEQKIGPSLKAHVHVLVASRLSDEGNLLESINQLKIAFNIYEEKTDKDGMMICLSQLGTMNSKLGDLNASLKYYEKMSHLSNVLKKENPSNEKYLYFVSLSMMRIGEINWELGDLNKALESFEQSNKIVLELYNKHLTEIDYKINLAISYEKLASLNRVLGRLDIALSMCREYYLLSKELFESNTIDESYKFLYLASNERMGQVNEDIGNYNEAVSFYKTQSQLILELSKNDPLNLEYKNSLSISYSHLGIINQKMNNYEESLKYYKKHNALKKELFDLYPNNVSHKNGLALANSNFGYLYLSMKKYNDALSYFILSNKTMIELNENYPDKVEFTTNLAVSYDLLGFTYLSLNDTIKAINNYRNSETIKQKLFVTFPSDAKLKKDLEKTRSILVNLGNN